ncbi:MAG: CPBP family intramembrane glutamic endopeptidase [Labilithrix sp.]
MVLFVKAGESAISRTPADLVGKSDRLEAETPVSLGPDGPFVPLTRAVRENGALRDLLAAEIPIPSLGRHYRRLRILVAGVVAFPVLMLVELDRELFARSGPGRIAIDALVAAWVIFELSRRTPRMPRIAAACMLAIAFRWGLVATRLCGHRVHWLVWTATTLAIAGAGLFVFRVPTRERIELELLDKLGVSRAQQRAALEDTEPSAAVVAAAVACAAGLPAVLHVLRALHVGFEAQALGFLAFAGLAPLLVKRFGDTMTRTAVPPARTMLAVAIGLSLTAAAVSCGRQFFDTGAEIAHCVNRLDNEARLARLAESQELARAVAHVRSSVLLVLLTAIVFPFAEERVYRGLLQDVLVRKFGRTYGIFAASVAFGLAHLGVYEVALYQTVLLGVGFGVAYAEGGILAAFFVHATWNLLQMG